ncbi:hypothetical protein J421_3730 [Gemmatirosa kalamazoonensis]|uniref:Uncharacterized protein n=1 Tax=Gemmatirosa kalamazoonensis TaxID=861299 RepID=W0RLF6_9BACT|nr:hypothetical protein [Gemmatirosa kalamazoonensis]AHG91267.1 hypothetical protein J421_3730 [Gemmatirosa kalamazoonensis]
MSTTMDPTARDTYAAPRDTAHGASRPVAQGPATRVAIALLVAATLAIAVAYASAFRTAGPPGWAAWLLATGVPLALVGVMVLGAARAGRLPGTLGAAFALVGLMLAGGFCLALALPAAGAGETEPLLLGLPRRAAIIVYGVGLLPVFVLPAAYALTFDAQTLRDEDLARVREAAVSWRAGRRERA